MRTVWWKVPDLDTRPGHPGFFSIDDSSFLSDREVGDIVDGYGSIDVGPDAGDHVPPVWRSSVQYWNLSL
jgi:hypothetical protein